jgi:hypothetical protein
MLEGDLVQPSTTQGEAYCLENLSQRSGDPIQYAEKRHGNVEYLYYLWL